MKKSYTLNFLMPIEAPKGGLSIPFSSTPHPSKMLVERMDVTLDFSSAGTCLGHGLSLALLNALFP